jgi:hypothetical protein
MLLLPGGISGQATPLIGAKNVLKQQVGLFPVEAKVQGKLSIGILAETRNMTRYIIAEPWAVG